MYTKGLILLLPIRQSEKKNRMIKKKRELAKIFRQYPAKETKYAKEDLRKLIQNLREKKG